MSALLVSALIGCGRAQPAPSAATTVPTADCPSTGAHMTLPDAPPDAVVQFMTANREGAWRGFRVLADGSLMRTSRSGEWEADSPLDAARLAALRAVVDAAGLHGRATRYGGDPPPDDAGGWALHTGGPQPVAMGGLGCRPAFVDTLVQAVAPHLTPSETGP